ncbi:anti-sigma factor family protein [Parafrankia discariae]|uniref:anti-sigma factor family protein n=1 Tax=Parafrankia discariae TaxID=365528 RepID=UPI00039DD17F|nr:zf-HC2 domain-containing protein [Parafrankia discariae]
MSSHLGERLTPLVDGQLSHDERDRALAHLACCSDCQAEVAEQRRLKARLSALATPALPSTLTSTLLSLGAREYQAARPAPAPPRRMPAMASGFVAEGSAPRRSVRPAASPARQAGLVRTGRPARPGGAPSRPGAFPGRSVALVGRPPGAVSPRVPAGSGRLTAGAPGCGAPGVALADPGVAVHATGHSRPAVITPRPRRHGRMRRTLVGSAAFMLLAVSGAALADGRPVPRRPDQTSVPTVATVIPAKAPAAGVPRPAQMIASVSFPRRP